MRGRMFCQTCSTSEIEEMLNQWKPNHISQPQRMSEKDNRGKAIGKSVSFEHTKANSLIIF